MTHHLSQPAIMGIVNVTPDSFSDGGLYLDAQAAIAHGHKLIAEGADILDIGGESTRPGSGELSVAEELQRVIPVIQALASTGKLISIDTRHAEVMSAALDAGAGMINDITALTHDPRSLDVVAKARVPVCLMHMQGTPATMQINPIYHHVTQDILGYLNERASVCEAAGIDANHIYIDPGIGFGKTLDHNLQLLRELDVFTRSRYKVLLGTSRKSFISKVMGFDVPAQDSLAGSLATVLRGMDTGVSIVRVHDVAATKQAMQVWASIQPV